MLIIIDVLFMKKYNGDWIECFNIVEYNDKKRPNQRGKILFETPCIDYLLSKEQFEKLKEKINNVVI